VPIGAVFEVACDRWACACSTPIKSTLATGIAANTATLALLPQAIRKSTKPVNDDF